MLPLDPLDPPVAGDTGPGDDAAHEQPIGFALTVRARREVAPATLPDLSVVADRSASTYGLEDGALDEPGDTRPARARALRRAGVPLSEIARQLTTDTLTVAAWVGEVAPQRRRQPGPSRTDGHAVAGVAQPMVEQPHSDQEPTDDDAEVAHHLARAAAADDARARLSSDAIFALGVGVLAGIAEVDPHAVTLTAGSVALVARALDVLCEEQPQVRSRARVIARVGPAVAGDLVRHRTATALGLDPTQVNWTRWRGAASEEAVQLLVRIAAPDLAAAVAGWVDAALERSPEAATAWHA